MRISRVMVAGGLLAVFPAKLSAQEIDMTLMMQWADVSVVAYSITGVYSKESTIVHGDKSGQVADVTDRVDIEVNWNVQESRIEGEAKFQNYPSVLENIHNAVSGCAPPVVKGTYEHIEVKAITSDPLGRIDLTGTVSYPEVDLTDCTGATEKRTVGSNQDQRVVYVPMLNPMVLAMPAMAESGGEMKFTIAPDKKSFVIIIDGWTWTYVPTRIS